MKRTALFLLLAGALLTPFILGSGFAQGWGGMRGGMMGNGYGMTGNGYGMMGNGYGMMNGNWTNQNVPAQYQLTDDQQEQIQNIRESYFAEIQPLQNQLATLQQDYTNSLRNNQSSDVLNSQRESIQELQTRINESYVNTQKQINNVLTADQLAYYGSGHQFLMMGFSGNMMANGNSAYGCYGANTFSQGNGSPQGMMNQ